MAKKMIALTMLCLLGAQVMGMEKPDATHNESVFRVVQKIYDLVDEARCQTKEKYGDMPGRGKDAWPTPHNTGQTKQGLFLWGNNLISPWGATGLIDGGCRYAECEELFLSKLKSNDFELGESVCHKNQNAVRPLLGHKLPQPESSKVEDWKELDQIMYAWETMKKVFEKQQQKSLKGVTSKKDLMEIDSK